MMGGIRRIFAYTKMCIQVALFILIALFLPKLGILYYQSHVQAASVPPYTEFKLGVENISDEFLANLGIKPGNKVSAAIITNQSGKDQLGRRTIDILIGRGVKLKKIFVPEHGLEGNVAYASKMNDGCDPSTNVPVTVLHDGHTPRKLDAVMLKGIDVLFFDIQEIGMRHNTYLTTLFQALESAAKLKKPLVVLDRPNVLGSCMEGPSVEDELKSAISYAAIPVRHGMTVGELAAYFNDVYLKNTADLHVVHMANYNRYQSTDAAFFTRLSPNISSLNSCYGYSMLGLLAEVRPFDVALGTEKAFQCIMLPDSIKFPQKKWYELSSILKDQGIESKFYRFFSQRKKQYCSGLWLHIQDMNTVATFKSLLMVLSFFKKSGVPLQFSKAFDKAMGTKKVREFLEGSVSKYELETVVNGYLHEFFNKASVAFKYRPHPYVVRL